MSTAPATVDAAEDGELMDMEPPVESSTADDSTGETIPEVSQERVEPDAVIFEPVVQVVLKEEAVDHLMEAAPSAVEQSGQAPKAESVMGEPVMQRSLEVPAVAADEQEQSNQTTVENSPHPPHMPFSGFPAIPRDLTPQSVERTVEEIGGDNGEAAIVAGMKRTRDDESGKLDADDASSTSLPKVPEKAKSAGTVSVDNAALERIPESIQQKCLGSVLYTGAHSRDKMSDRAQDTRLFLLPRFHTSHLYCTIDVRIPAEYLLFAENIALKNQALWGTDVYTDDSDIVSILVHSGHYRPIDSPTVPDLEEAKLQNDSKVPISPHTKKPTFGAKPSPLPIRTLPPTPDHPYQAKRDPFNSRLPDHDLCVTLRILPRLTRYTGSARFGVSSRGWGCSHDGESIRVERIEVVPRGSVGRMGRKKGTLEWATLGLIGRREEVGRLPIEFDEKPAVVVPDEKMEGRRAKKAKVPSKSSKLVATKKVPPKLMEDSVTVVFSPYGGHACIKYQPSSFTEWPEHLRETLRDIKALKVLDMPESKLAELVKPFEETTRMTLSDLASMEKLPYWQLRMKKEVLHIETADGKSYEVSSLESIESPTKYCLKRFAKPSVAASTRECIPEPPGSSKLAAGESPQEFSASDIVWKPATVEISSLTLRAVRFFWRRRTPHPL
ncbi:histone deacetylation protein Rxt3-domain-containing protein [Chytridium lagenaria]|nr:histone deacetylation protein Rxt3-domain-containing protein [Chytridium lagenaria]